MVICSPWPSKDKEAGDHLLMLKQWDKTVQQSVHQDSEH